MSSALSLKPTAKEFVPRTTSPPTTTTPTTSAITTPAVSSLIDLEAFCSMHDLDDPLTPMLSQHVLSMVESSLCAEAPQVVPARPVVRPAAARQYYPLFLNCASSAFAQPPPLAAATALTTATQAAPKPAPTMPLHLQKLLDFHNGSPQYHHRRGARRKNRTGTLHLANGHRPPFVRSGLRA